MLPGVEVVEVMEVVDPQQSTTSITSIVPTQLITSPQHHHQNIAAPNCLYKPNPTSPHPFIDLPSTPVDERADDRLHTSDPQTNVFFSIFSFSVSTQ